MFAEFREWLKDVIFNRTTVLILIFIALFSVLIQRLFVMQIVNGEEYLDNFKLTIKKETTLPSTRGNIYDRNGVLLAHNELAYSVTIEDNFESGSGKNARMNESILKAIRLINQCGDKVSNEFNIILNEDNEYEYTLSGTRLYRFIADVYGCKKIDDLKTDQKNSTPNELVEYLAGKDCFGIGEEIELPNGKKEFAVGEGLTKEELLNVITIRYGLKSNSFQKYLTTEIASNVSNETIAAIKENSDILQGIDIRQNTIRIYEDSEYFAHIIGYTGYASQEDLDELKDSEYDYTMNDTVGKSGIEKSMESYLQGTKGKDVIYVDNVGKVIDNVSHVNPKAGNDVYLSIDSDLQKAVYNMLEQKLAGILVSKILNCKTYDNSVVKESSMMIPIDDVYYAFFNNNVIDIEHLKDEKAGTYEKEVYLSFKAKQSAVLAQIKDELLNTATPYNELSDEVKVYESYIVNRLMSTSTGVLVKDLVDTEDETYLAWTVKETISLSDYLHYCLKNNWIDVTKFKVKSQYSDSSEVYEQLVDYIIEDLYTNTGFSKKMFKYMIADDMIHGKQICMILYEQKVLYGTSAEKKSLESGEKTPYEFIINKISNLEITPSMLALDPCSGSCVVANRNGELLALVTYPGYDNNKLANTIDADYYSFLLNDQSAPLYNYATQQMTAPGSTFKPISAATALEEGTINYGETIECQGVYDLFNSQKKCWIYPGGHGHLDAAEAIGNSCNVFFYTVGYRLATNNLTTGYSEEAGLARLRKYTDMFGLTEKTGVEMEENEPEFSDTLPVDSAIGQGSHNYTTIGLSRYVTTIANKGSCYKYTLLNKVVNPKGTTVATFSPTIKNSVILNDTTWSTIHRGMRMVVEKAATFKGFPMAVAGKTGTAQTSKSRTNHALFIGFAPYEDPQMSVAIRIAYGYTSANAASLARDVISYYFDLEDAEELVNGIADEATTEVIED